MTYARDMTQYFHKIYPEEWLFLVGSKMTWEELVKKYYPPAWCSYRDAVDPLGCWGLIYGYVADQGEDYCRECELHKANVSHD